MCAQRRLWSASAFAQSEQSSLPVLRSLGPKLPIKCTVKTDQTGRMPGWSESSLCAQVILIVLSCSDSNVSLSRQFEPVSYLSVWCAVIRSGSAVRLVGMLFLITIKCFLYVKKRKFCWIYHNYSTQTCSLYLFLSICNVKKISDVKEYCVWKRLCYIWSWIKD